jgi:hypothetical protein
MSFPLYIFLIAYFVFLGIFFIFLFINITHLTNTGTLTLASFAVSVLVCAFIAYVLYTTYFLLLPINWSETIKIDFSKVTAFLNNSSLFSK